jgi:hypothetical protein
MDTLYMAVLSQPCKIVLRHRVILSVGANLLVEWQILHLQYKRPDAWSVANIYRSTGCFVPEDRAVCKTVHHLEPYRVNGAK